MKPGSRRVLARLVRDLEGGPLVQSNTRTKVARRCSHTPGRGRNLTGGSDMAKRTCSLDDCDKPHQALGYCQSHAQRYRKHGDPRAGGPPRQRSPDGKCTVDGCERPHDARGYCRSHYTGFYREHVAAPCKVEGCDDPSHWHGMCVKHVTRYNRWGSTDLPERPRQVCAAEGCDGTALARGWCRLHYERWRKHGDPHRVIASHERDVPDMRVPVELRFWTKIDVGHPLGCWMWTAGLSTQGYGVIVRDGRTDYAHRVAYELLRGAVPDGLELDHLCRNRPCVNPDHLEAVTHRVNWLRGESYAARHTRGVLR